MSLDYSIRVFGLNNIKLKSNQHCVKCQRIPCIVQLQDNIQEKAQDFITYCFHLKHFISGSFRFIMEHLQGELYQTNISKHGIRLEAN